MNLFLQYKVGRDVVRNAAVLAPAQRSTVKRRVRSGHFDHDFWIFTLLLVGLSNEICKCSKTARIWHNLRKWNASLTERVEKTLLHQLMFVY